MMELLTDTLRDTSLIEWWAMAILPFLGAVSFTQIWKVDRWTRTGIKPSNHTCQLVATVFCIMLSTLVQGLMGARSWPAALGVGLMIGPAAPLLWMIAKALAPARIARAMRGGRHPQRAGGTWSDAERRRLLIDTLYGDDDSTMREKIRAARAQREARKARDG